MALLTNIVRAFEFNEGSGTTATDATGTANGTIAGAAYDATNKKLGSHALSFGPGDGSDEVDLGSSIFNGQSAWTFSCWCRKTDTTEGSYLVAEGSIPDGFIIYSSNPGSGDTRRALGIYVNGTNYEIDDNFFADNLNTWVMITMTYDGTSYRVYNGTTLIHTQAAGAHTGGAGNTTIGNRATGARSWKGQIDNVYMSHDVISPTDLATRFNSGTGIEHPYGEGVDTAPTVTTQAVTSITETTATGNGNVTADGGATITERGVAVSTSATPTTGDTTFTSAGTTGTFTASMTGLTGSTLYYVRAYAINAEGTSYGSEVTFTTAAAPTAPTVTTQAVTDVATTTATGNGNVTADGGETVTERGVCWSTTTAPTTADSTATSAGTTGAFTAAITGLSGSTLYYVRAYAINSEGTSYGSEVTFTTTEVTVPKYAAYTKIAGELVRIS